MKSLRVYYWYVKMPRFGYVQHGLKYFFVLWSKTYSALQRAACSGPHPGSRRVARSARISETRILLRFFTKPGVQ